MDLERLIAWVGIWLGMSVGFAVLGHGITELSPLEIGVGIFLAGWAFGIIDAYSTGWIPRDH